MTMSPVHDELPIQSASDPSRRIMRGFGQCSGPTLPLAQPNTLPALPAVYRDTGRFRFRFALPTMHCCPGLTCCYRWSFNFAQIF
jgi:hypothetical protein